MSDRVYFNIHNVWRTVCRLHIDSDVKPDGCAACEPGRLHVMLKMRSSEVFTSVFISNKFMINTT